MDIVAPVSKQKKSNLKLYIAACIVAAVVLAYDGYLSRYKWSYRYSFYEEHVLNNNGVPDGTMRFNQVVAPVLGVAAVLLALRLWMLKDKKLTARETALILGNGQQIPYDSIERIDKTHFDSKGFVVVNYRSGADNESRLKLDTRDYDNLSAVLDRLVEKIT